MKNPNENNAEAAERKKMKMEIDHSELAEEAGSGSTSDEPGDDAILTQEELYEGISSGQMPSEKAAKNAGPGGPERPGDPKSS